MDNILLKHYNNRYWQKADVFKNGKLIYTINKYYSVTEDWIIAYDSIGGSGTGYTKGDVVKRIYIGNSNFTKETVINEENCT